MIVAPTEPPALRALGLCNLEPERRGCDILFHANHAFHGIQRKELKDFIASVHDGRLSKEVAQMSASLATRLLVIEGQPKWSLDGELLGQGFGKPWTLKAHNAYLWSVQARGVWVSSTLNLAGTIELAVRFEEWVRKGKHRSLDVRPGPGNTWGRVTNRDYQRHLVMGVEGYGPELADAVIDALGMPFKLCVTEEQLKGVAGVGPKKAKAMVRALGEVES